MCDIRSKSHYCGRCGKTVLKDHPICPALPGNTHIAIGFHPTHGFAGMKYMPYATLFHPVFGPVDLYDLRTCLTRDGSGASSSFFTNGAHVDAPLEYGLKLFNAEPESMSMIEAWASKQRQDRAVEFSAAPPTHRMIRVLYKQNICWGYQTCLADVDYNDYYLPGKVQEKLKGFTADGLQHGGCPLGTQIENSERDLCGDMHSGNCGIWQGEPVAIDFGWHCWTQGRRHEAVKQEAAA